MKYAADIAIFGGGVAGLWLLTQLRRIGYSVLLIETKRLGEGQTGAAQGILHGGMKYALDGLFSDAAQALTAMPARWRQALDGNGNEDTPDLSGVTIVAHQQLLWSITSTLPTRLLQQVAKRLLHGAMQPLDRADYPAPFDRHPPAALFRLHEQVIDPHSLIARLAALNPGRILTGQPVTALQRDAQGVTFQRAGEHYRVRRLLLAAGAGNRDLLAALQEQQPTMQLRPLQMVLLSGGALPPLFGHCLGATNLPRLTVTSHLTSSGERLWYLGGELAEQGVGRTPDTQIRIAKALLHELLPGVADLPGLRWRTLPMARAEASNPGAIRPNGVKLYDAGTILTVWPTKLVLAPALGDAVSACLRQQPFQPEIAEQPLAAAAHPPQLAPPPWERLLHG